MRMAFMASIVPLAFAGQATAASLSVSAPDPLTVEPATIAQNSLFTEQLGIRAPADGPQPVVGEYLCTVGYFPQIEAHLRTQEEYNAELLDPAFIAGIKTNLANGMSAVDQSDFMVGPAAGLEFMGTPKNQPDHRYYMAMWQMPTGNIQVSCSTTEDRIDEAVGMFRAIRDSVAYY